MDRVTIVTITYNSACFVRQAIESVLSQSFSEFEYIICDDCSTDNTWEIIQQYQDPRIKAYRNEKNIGEYPNRNKTLNIANGNYIIWIDGDDILYPHGLEFMVKMLDAFPESAMALVNEYRPDIIYPYELSSKEIYKYDFFGKSVTHYGLPYTLFRTEVLKEYGGFPEKYIAGDTFVKRMISQKYKSVLISDGVSWWRQPSGQASAKLRKDMVGDIENLFISKCLLSQKDCPLTKKEKELAYSNIYGSFIRNIIRRYLFKLKFSFALKLFNKSGLKLNELKYVFKKQYINFTNNASNNSPLSIDIKMNPFTKKQNAYRKN